jgi:hypothetical protein
LKTLSNGAKDFGAFHYRKYDLAVIHSTSPAEGTDSQSVAGLDSLVRLVNQGGTAIKHSIQCKRRTQQRS